MEIDGVMCFYKTAKIAEDGTFILPKVTALGQYAVMISEFSDLPGDVDNNGIINVMDALAILKKALNICPVINNEVADFNNDGSVNIIDALEVLKKSISS